MIEPKRTYTEETTLETHYTYPHLGLLSMAANLEDARTEVDYFSTNTSNKPLSALKRKLKNRYDFVCLSTITATIDYSYKIAEAVKKNTPNTKVVLGGVYAWLYPREVLKNRNIDFVIRGMGEIPLLGLIRKNPINKIPGLCYKGKAEIIINNPYVSSPNDFRKIKSILKYSKYNEVYSRTKAFRNTRHLFTSFGCPYNCNFCSVPKLYRGRMLFRDVKAVLAEIKELSKRTSRIMFVDPDLNINKEHFLSLFKAILKAKEKGQVRKNTRFIIQARLDCFDEEMLKIAKEAKIIALVGIESLSQRIRKFDLNKGGKLARMDEEEVKASIEEITKYIQPYLYFILATPETRMKDLITNLKYIKNLKTGWYEINIHITPFPETNYYDQYKDTNLMVWEDLTPNHGATRIPKELKCQDQAVERHIEKAFSRAAQNHLRRKKANFSNLFLKELVKEVSL